MPMLDRELNDDDALREMARLHGRAMTSVIRVSERDPGEVEELVADVLILAAQRLDDLRDLTDLQLHAWLVRTARYLCANHVRRASTRRRFVERLAREPMPVVPEPADVFETSELAEEADRQARRVFSALERMAPDYRQVLVLDALGETGTSIGATMGISPGAARKRLARARARFREVFATVYENEDARDV